MPAMGDNTDGFKALALAIVTGAVKDYGVTTRKLRKLQNTTVPENAEERIKFELKIKRHEKNLRNIEKFIQGEWCSALVYFGTNGEIDPSELDFLGFVKKFIEKRSASLSSSRGDAESIER